jgi:DNA processing protein
MNRDRFRSLVQAFGSFTDTRAAGPAAVARQLRCNDEDAQNIVRGATENVVARELEGLAAVGGRAVSMSDGDYPSALRQSPALPPLLFVRGTLSPQDEAAVGVIGSRKATSYGMAAARSISRELARAGVVIVSGFARGIDTASHRAAMDVGGRTLAILGCGLDVCYPPENHGLVDSLISHGAFITEYPLGTPPHKGNFPERNQIIAALSLGIAVMEAAERSGTLITCRHALEENRLLFALPGDITRHSSRGTNRLIREGAILIQDASDILRDLAPRLRSIIAGWQLEDHAPDEEGQDNRLAVKATRRARQKAEESLTDTAGNGEPGPRRSTKRPPSAQHELPGLQDFATDGELSDLGLGREASGFGQGGEHSGFGLKSQQRPGRKNPATAPLTDLPQEQMAPATIKHNDLSPESVIILQIILREPIQYDNLVAEATAQGLSAHKVAAQLLRLELQGLIQQMPGRVYAAL